jgi:phosphomannomutase
VLDPKAFKAYDVRGVYPTELDEAGAYAVGRAYVEQFSPTRIAVGRDMRESSPTMAAAVREGAADGGAEVLDLGMVGTEMVYFAVGELGLDGGIAVTASHNPKQYTGMKIVRRGALPVGGESGLFDVRDRAVAGVWHDGPRGEIREEDIWARFVDRVLSFIDVDALKPLRIVIDAANGMAGAMLPPVLDRLPLLDVVRCYFEPDGSFPNHEPNPLLPENREFIIAKMREAKADFGVAYDGDADRCFFVDDTGEFVPGDFTTALFAETILAREPGGKVIYDVRASWAVPEAIERAGGEALINRVGHAFIKQRMRDVDAVFAGEVSAHYYFRDFSQADSGTVPFLLMCELVSRRGSLSEVLAPLRKRYFITGELNTPVDDVAATLAKLEERFGADGKVGHLDGLSVEFADWHFNVRPSNTEPLLRLNLEARSQALMEEKRDDVLAAIRG